MSTQVVFVDDDVTAVVHEGLDGHFSNHPHHSANDDVHDLSAELSRIDAQTLRARVTQRSRHASEPATVREHDYVSVDGGVTWSVLR